MLVLRSLRVSSSRFFASPASTTSIPKQITRQDVDFVVNPNEKYIEGFMKHSGNARMAFKESDIVMWKDSFGDDYKLQMVCLKGTTKVIGTMNTIHFKPIDSANKQAIFLGLGWVDPEYRGSRVIEFVSDMVWENVPDKKMNVVSLINQNARQFWHLFSKKKEFVDKGHDTMASYYISFYKGEDFFVPDNLSFDGITVKRATEVPKVDMIRYDQKIHPYHREKYMISHMHDKDGFGKVAYDKNGKVIGMAQAVIYPSGDCNLGPVYGDNPRVVQTMFLEILKDIKASDKQITRWVVISAQFSQEGFQWIAPFLKCEPHRIHYCNFMYGHTAPKNVDFSKLYSPTHAQLCLL